MADVDKDTMPGDGIGLEEHVTSEAKADVAETGATPKGGDLDGCLSAFDIDEALSSVEDKTDGTIAASAMDFYTFRTAESEQETAKEAERIRAQADEKKRLLLPLHLRHHWVLANVEDGGRKATVYDSAPSACVRKDVLKWLRKLWPHIAIRFSSAGKQRRGTNECGLFLVRTATRILQGIAVAESRNVESLAHMREQMRNVRGGGKPPTKKDEGIDVDQWDEDWETTPITVRELRNAGVACEGRSEPVSKWITTLFDMQIKDRQRDLERIDDEWQTLPELEQNKRHREFRRRKAPYFQKFTRDQVELTLTRVPGEVRASPLWENLRRIAEEKAERNRKEVNRSAIEELAQGGKRGAFVDTAVLRAVADKFEHPGWHIIDLHELQTGKARVPHPVPANVATFVLHNSHYTLLTGHRDHEGTYDLQWRDSLNGISPPKGMQPTITLFRQALQRQGAKCSKGIRTKKVKRQDTNECAIEVVRNLADMTKGSRGSMSRDLITKVAMQVLKLESPALKDFMTSPLWKEAWTSNLDKEGEGSDDKERVIIKQFSHDPYAVDVLPPRDGQTDPAETDDRRVFREILTLEQEINLEKVERAREKEARIAQARRSFEGTMEIPALHSFRKRGYEGFIPQIQIREPSRATLLHLTATRLEPHDTLTVEWSYGSEHATWLCTVVYKRTNNSVAIRPIAEKCTDCEGWHWTYCHQSELYEFPDTDQEFRYHSVTFWPENLLQIEDERKCSRFINLRDDDDAVSEVGSDADGTGLDPVPKNDIEELRGVLTKLQNPQAAPNGWMPPAPNDERRADDVLRWTVLYGRPPCINEATYSRLDEESHQSARRWLERLKSLVGRDPNVRRASLPAAVVETVMRTAEEKSFQWSTISTALSQLTTALRLLPLYVYGAPSVKIKEHVLISETQKTAARRAKVDALNRKQDPGLTHQQIEQVIGLIKNPKAQALLRLSWSLAGRVGDVRRLRPENIKFEPTGRSTESETQPVLVRALFVEGKGFTFWGPYEVLTFCHEKEAKILAELCREASRGKPVFNMIEQEVVATAIKAIRSPTDLGKLTLRSIRRGRLQDLANRGATERELMLLSGHKRRRTLLEYLGFNSTSEAEEAAYARWTKEVAESTQGPAGGMFVHPNARAMEVRGGGFPPMPVTAYSGFAASRGRRKKREPQLFPKKPPNRNELGLRYDDALRKEEAGKWPLHIKETGTIRWDELKKLATARGRAYHAEIIDDIRRWTEEPGLYGVSWPELTKYEVPGASFTPEQVQEMIRAGKIERYEGKIFSACRAFLVPEEEKQRLRIIFEPLLNKFIDHDRLPNLSYPSRLERRQNIKGAKFFREYDFSAYYDQFELGPNTKGFFVIRVGDETYNIKKMPMGSSFSAHIAQYVTWIILADLVEKYDKVKFGTMIDNVSMAGSDREQIEAAGREFEERCIQCGLAVRMTQNAEGPSQTVTFLGEEFYIDEETGCNLVRNRAKNVEKLREAYQRLQQGIQSDYQRLGGTNQVRVTARHLIGTMALGLWCLHTINIFPRDRFEILQLYSKIIRLAAGDYDAPMLLDGQDVRRLGTAIGPALDNEWTAIPDRTEQATTGYTVNPEDYDLMVTIDASKFGYAAIVTDTHTNEQWLVKKGWLSFVRSSASAEPRAVSEVAELLAQRGFHGKKICFITDHDAMVKAQRKPDSGCSGFSHAFWLNQAYKSTYAAFSLVAFIHVAGKKNQADAESRTVATGQGLSVQPIVSPLSFEGCTPVPPKRREWFQV